MWEICVTGAETAPLMHLSMLCSNSASAQFFLHRPVSQNSFLVAVAVPKVIGVAEVFEPGRGEFSSMSVQLEHAELQY